MTKQEFLKLLENQIEFVFKDKNLLYTAFVHPSYANDCGVQSYDRLEHLGDSIIDLCITDFLYSHKKNYNPQQLTEKRKQIVSKPPLSRAADILELGKFVLVSKKQVINEKIKSDVFEALTAAIYLDSKKLHGLSKINAWLLKNLDKEIKDALSDKIELLDKYTVDE
ncbi:MAG: hypothetical protein LBU60_02960 [Clostridiales bacterium]|jgi:ribonuclease-3|nr:hypothetical protein [Clostridiales bacterium]